MCLARHHKGAVILSWLPRCDYGVKGSVVLPLGRGNSQCCNSGTLHLELRTEEAIEERGKLVPALPGQVLGQGCRSSCSHSLDVAGDSGSTLGAVVEGRWCQTLCVEHPSEQIYT